MDVQLEDGICFKIFENCAIKTPVVFTTAFDDYSLKTFKVNSVDYLSKPIVFEQIKNAFEKFKTAQHPKMDFIKIALFINQFQTKTKEHFLIKNGEHYRSIQVSGINCFYIKERCNFINVDNGKNYAIDYSLDRVEVFMDSKTFFEINRNTIINFMAIHRTILSTLRVG